MSRNKVGQSREEGGLESGKKTVESGRAGGESREMWNERSREFT